MENALIALGANVALNDADLGETLVRAIGRIDSDCGKLLAQSRVFRTPCFPEGAGPDYLNAAVMIKTPLAAAALMTVLHAIEAEFGRERRERWGQRTLDLDLLAMEHAVQPDRETFDKWANLPVETQVLRAPGQLILPHPRLHERAFVLVPLADVAPTWRHPVFGTTVKDMVSALPQTVLDTIIPQ